MNLNRPFNTDLPFVSVVIPTFNRISSLLVCVGSLFKQSYPPERFEIVIVDDGSTDSTLEILEKYYKNVDKVKIFSQKNQGSYAARNLGIKNSKGEIICFTDDDCIAERDWIRNLVNGYKIEQIGGVGGKIVGYNITKILERYVEDIGGLGQEKFQNIFSVTANASYRKKVLDEIGVFDPYFKSGGDADLGIRVNLKKYKILYSPDALIFHKHRISINALSRQFFKYGTGYVRLHRKYPKNFILKRILKDYILGISKNLVICPVIIIKSIFLEEDRSYYLIKRFFDIIVMISFIRGIASETLSGPDYPREKTNQRLEIFEKSNLSGWGL